MRDVEKTQTKLTLAMMELLFQAEEPTKKPLMLEKKIMEEKTKIGFQQRINPNNELYTSELFI